MKKWLIPTAGLIVILIVAIIWMNHKYFYTPFTYPKDLVNEYTHSFKDFKKPIQIYVEKQDPSAEYTHMYSKRMKDEKIVSRLLTHFDRATELEHISMDNYVDELPENDISYSVFVLGRLDEGRDRDLLIINYSEELHYFYLNNNRFF